jgi:hypothetical protein
MLDTKLSLTHKFLDAFNFALITVSVQPEAPDSYITETSHFSALNRVRAVTPETFYSDDFQAELRTQQMSGCAIYFTMNEGDGKPKDPPKNLNCGRRTNITTLRTLAIDTDEADAHALTKRLIELHLHPHFIIETRPKRYHFYFLIEPVPAEGEHILQWKAMQKYLASLVPNLDQSLGDINQVLRVPGFFNLKKDKHAVNVKKSFDLETNNLEALYLRTNAHIHSDFDNITTKPYTAYEFPVTKPIPSGSRRTEITRYIEHIMENVLPLDAHEKDYFIHIDAFILTHLSVKDQPEFLPGGSRRQNIEQYFHDQRGYRLRKHHQQQSLQASKEFDQQIAIEENSLPDSFYLNFPEDLGQITREIHAYTPTTALELCFAGALCISGALKAESFRFNGLWPLLNGLIIGGSGSGKSTIKAIIEKCLTTAGLAGSYPQLFDFQNTVQSLHTCLYSAGGVGTTIVDESGDYLQIITAKNAPGYAKALKKYYKESTTGRSDGTRLTAGGSLSFQVPPIEGGMLGLWIMLQPDKFLESLSMADLADGFLPRFFIFNGESNLDMGNIIAGDGSGKSFKPSLDLEVLMQSITQFTAFGNNTSIATTLKTVEDEAKAKNPKTKRETIRLLQRDAIHSLRATARKMGPAVPVTIDDEAKYAVMAYIQERQEMAKEIFKNDKNAPELVIYIRMEEMLMRMLCNAAPLTAGSKAHANITLEIAENCIAFHRFQTARFFKKEMKEMSSDRDMDYLVDVVSRAVKKHGGAVTAKQITLAMRHNKRPRNLTNLLRDAVARGEIRVIHRDHLRIKGEKVFVYSLPISEDSTEIV